MTITNNLWLRKRKKHKTTTCKTLRKMTNRNSKNVQRELGFLHSALAITNPPPVLFSEKAHTDIYDLRRLILFEHHNNPHLSY